MSLSVAGRPAPPPNAVPEVGRAFITPDYFRAMGVRFEAGRLFDSRDTETSEPVALINDALARRYFPRENPIGKQLRVGERGKWLTIVGVVASEKDRYFFREMSWDEIPMVFQPVAQQPPSAVTLLLRTAAGARQAGTAMQKYIRELDSNVATADPQTMNDELSRVLAYPRFRAVVLAAFAALALLLAGLGLYGVLAQSTAQRTREFGVRMAIGARRRDVLAVVVRQGMLLTCAGLAAGIALALGITRLLSGLLYGVRAGALWIWCGVSLVLLAVALLATILPAWRAARVDPVISLRYE
jgi:putative ABC transport system permease protein